MHRELQEALRLGDGLVCYRDHPTLRDALKRACAVGDLVRLFPGTYLTAAAADSVPHRIAALSSSDPNAVVTGAAAARVTWWRQIPVPTIEAYRPTHCDPVQGFHWLRAMPPTTLVHGCLASPALQVLDLIPTVGPRAVDEALRRRAVTLDELTEALAMTPRRSGNAQRRWVLEDSRDQPWSPAEREFHRILRDAGITGWRTNVRVEVAGRRFFLDVALPELKLAFEIDGFEFHGTRAAFESDRERDALLAGCGWQVVRISAAQVSTCLDTVRRIIAARMRCFHRS